MAVLITAIVLYPASNAWLGGCSNQEEWKLATSALWHALSLSRSAPVWLQRSSYGSGET